MTRNSLSRSTQLRCLSTVYGIMTASAGTPVAASTARSTRSLSGMVSSRVGSVRSRGRKLRSLSMEKPASISWSRRRSKIAASSGELMSAIFIRLR